MSEIKEERVEDEAVGRTPEQLKQANKAHQEKADRNVQKLQDKGVKAGTRFFFYSHNYILSDNFLVALSTMRSEF